MSLMIAAALALTAQTAECALEYDIDERRGGYPTAIRAVCPDDAAGLQAAADASLALITLDPPASRNRRAHGDFDLARTLVMQTRGDGRWSAAPGQEVISLNAMFPTRAARYGADLAYCAVGLTPDASGVPQSVGIGCLINTRDGGSLREMEAAMADAVTAWRMAPTEAAYCYSTETVITATIYFEGRVQSRGPGLDPEDLPEFCAQAS